MYVFLFNMHEWSYVWLSLNFHMILLDKKLGSIRWTEKVIMTAINKDSNGTNEQQYDWRRKPAMQVFLVLCIVWVASYISVLSV